MKRYYSIPSHLPPTALTIGSFDGVHLGHQAILEALRNTGQPTTVVTFTNHPTELFTSTPVCLLTSLEQKLTLLEKSGIDFVIALPFGQEFASLTYDAFLSLFPLTHLILGVGSVFGKGRLGTAENVQSLATKRDFQLTYLPKLLIEQEPVSSRRIRNAVLLGDIPLAAKLLGRPYTVDPKEEKSCLPPDGIYPVLIEGKSTLLEIKNRSLSKPSTPIQFI